MLPGGLVAIFFLPLLQGNTEREKYNLFIEWDIVGIGFCLS